MYITANNLPFENLITKWLTRINGVFFMIKTSTVQIHSLQLSHLPYNLSESIVDNLSTLQPLNSIAKNPPLIPPVLPPILPPVQLPLPKICVACDADDVAGLAKQAPMPATVMEVPCTEQLVLHCVRVIQYNAHVISENC